MSIFFHRYSHKTPVKKNSSSIPKKCLAFSLSIILIVVPVLINTQTVWAYSSPFDKTFINSTSSMISAENEDANKENASSQSSAVNITAKAAVLI